MHLGQSEGREATLRHNRTICCFSRPKCFWRHHHYAPRNEREQSVNDLRPSILHNQRAMQLQWSIMIMSATFLGIFAYDKIVTMSRNQRQPSVSYICAVISDNLTRMERRTHTMNLAAAFIGKNATDDIGSTSYNGVPTVRQGSECYTAINCIMLFLNGVLCGQSLQTIGVFNIANMHAMSDWSDHFRCSFRVLN